MLSSKNPFKNFQTLTLNIST